MSVKEQIEESKRKISSLKSDISRKSSEISREESRKIQANSGQTMGLVYMTNSQLRAYGTYKYLSSSHDYTSLTLSISRLKSQKSSLESELYKEELNLKTLEDKYKNLPEAKLIVTDNGIFIEGDQSQKDILTPVYDKIETYVSEHRKIMNSEQVARYNALKSELEANVDKSSLPQATKKNIEELEILKNRLISDFGFVVINGKILVDSDFISRPIAIAQDKVKNLQERIDRNQARRDAFEPTFWGKVFKGVEKKQRQELEDKISKVDFEYKTYQGEAKADAEYYSEIKSKYVDPSLPQIELLGRLTRLTNSSYEVSKYIKNEEKYKKDVDPKTVLIEIGIGDVPDYVIKSLKSYLDSHDLQLSRESVIKAIHDCSYHKDLAEQIEYKPTKTQTEEKSSDIGYGFEG